MRTASGSCLLTGVTLEQCARLEDVFARLSSKGWAIPEWLLKLEDSISGETSEIVDNDEGI